MNLLYINNFASDVYGPAKADCVNVSWYMAVDMQYFILTPIFLTIIWKKPIAGYITSALLLAAGAASQITFTVRDNEFFHGGFGYYVKPWNRSQPYVVGLLLGYILHRMRNQPTLRIQPIMNLWIWMIMSTIACTVLYGVTQWNIVSDPTIALPCQPCEEECEKPSLVVRAIFNGFAKIGWSVPLAWVILACVKGQGGPINSILSWSAWVPLARVQYCVYLLHRSIIYIINSQTEYLVRYSHLLLTMQDLAILTITTGVAFLFVILFEAPIVQLEKLVFGCLGVGKMPQKKRLTPV